MEVLQKLAAGGAGPVSEKLLGEAVLAAQDAAQVRIFFNQEKEQFEAAVSALVDTLNKEASTKAKTNALVLLANFAKYKSTRDCLYNALKRIDPIFEETLLEKERASENLGTSLGKLHSTMLVLMMRVFSYRVGGNEVLEYASEKTAFAIDLLIEIMKVPTYEAEVLANCCAALLDLSTPNKAAGANGDAQRAFSGRVEALIDLLMQRNIVAVVSSAIRRNVKNSLVEDASGKKVVLLTNAVHTAVALLCRMAINMYLFASEGASATGFRQSILVSTDLITTTLPRYVVATCDEIYRCIDAGTGAVLFPITPGLGQGISHALKCCAFATFHLGKHNFKMRRANVFTVRLLGLPVDSFVDGNLELYAHLFHYMVNIDSLAGEHALEEANMAADLPEQCKSSVILRMASQLLSALGGRRAEKLWGLVALSSQQVPLARDAVSYDLLSHLFEVTMTKGTPAEASLQQDHAALPDLDLVAGALDARMASLEADHPDIGPIRAEFTQTLTQKPEELRLLGDLPSLAGPGSGAGSPSAVSTYDPLEAPQLGPDDFSVPTKPEVPKKAGEAWQSVVQQLNCPREFLCAINGHLLRHPVRAPSGEVFERQTIETWLAKVGSTNPVTGEVLTKEALVDDKELAAKILHWQISQNTQANDDDGAADLYQF